MAGPPLSWKLGSMPLMKTRREPSSDRRQPQTAFRHSAVAAGAAAGSEVRALDTSRFDNLMARPEFGEFWRVHVILFLCWILASRQNLLTNGKEQFHGHISLLFI